MPRSTGPVLAPSSELATRCSRKSCSPASTWKSEMVPGPVFDVYAKVSSGVTAIQHVVDSPLDTEGLTTVSAPSDAVAYEETDPVAMGWLSETKSVPFD